MRLQITITSGTCKSLMTSVVVPWDALTTFAGRQAAKIIQTAPAHGANKTEEQEKKGGMESRQVSKLVQEDCYLSIATGTTVACEVQRLNG